MAANRFNLVATPVPSRSNYRNFRNWPLANAKWIFVKIKRHTLCLTIKLCCSVLYFGASVSVGCATEESTISNDSSEFQMERSVVIRQLLLFVSENSIRECSTFENGCVSCGYKNLCIWNVWNYVGKCKKKKKRFGLSL